MSASPSAFLVRFTRRSVFLGLAPAPFPDISYLFVRYLVRALDACNGTLYIPRMTEANSIKFDRAAGLALILGSIAGLITMALHPTGHDVLNSPNSALFMRLSIAVHALALLASPTMFLGALGLSRRLSLSSLRVLTALAFYVFAQVTVVSAAVMSGFVNTFVARQIANAAPPATDV